MLASQNSIATTTNEPYINGIIIAVPVMGMGFMMISAAKFAGIGAR
jgi:hypothetical protein